ncbi:hypothetical protein MLD38_020983 [Melastoma candidum]|uniref:Uncharacterized protein n=1 Tax=Melastoma candidum TaxID=119954 RepID=A0ACB9QDZ2_9MYRT|nr:hypothetical protein MLD38_020983 [Melastoma candidum]
MELGILMAQGLQPMKTKDGHRTPDAYCVAKYGKNGSTANGVKKMGEIQLPVRFSCSSRVKMMHIYSQPLLPKMHFIHPLPGSQLDHLRYQATQIVLVHLSCGDFPLRKEVIEYMLEMGSQMWSMRRTKGNIFRMMDLLGRLMAPRKQFHQICNWKNPMMIVVAHVVLIMLIISPQLILPMIFVFLLLIGGWGYRRKPRMPMHMDTRFSYADAHPDEIDEEFDTFPTSRDLEVVRMRYDRLRSITGRIHTMVGNLATQGDRLQSLLSWRDRGRQPCS